MYFSLTFTLLLGALSGVNSAKILFFHTAATPSHRSSIFPLAGRLADVGHNVTYVFPLHRRPGSHPKVEELFASKLTSMYDAYSQKCEINHRLNNTLDAWMYEAIDRMPEFCAAFYDSPEIQELLARPGKHFDLILMDGGFGQCAYGLVHRYQAKHILFNTITYPFLHDTFGVVPESSSVPDFMFSLKPSSLMGSIWSRTLNAMAPLIWKYIYTHSMHRVEQVVREKMNVTGREGMPSFAEIDQDTSLVLHNTNFLEDYPMSLPPLFVSYSGLLCSKQERASRQPLPEKLEAFLNDADGFVYISFGSSVAVNSLPETLLHQFITMFEAFPNLKFLWKWGGQAPRNTPKNVLLQSWFPQMDVLAHPKIKAFMTQAGRPSTQEALCYGVPLIAVPMFGDQMMNADRLKDLGVAVNLNIDYMTADTLIKAVEEVATTDSYKNKAMELSALFRDRPMDPLDNAHYWIEYVLRHNNTNLLKPLSMKQPWWQRRLLDVYALLLTLFLILIAGLILMGYGIIKVTARLLISSKNNSVADINKKKD